MPHSRRPLRADDSKILHQFLGMSTAMLAMRDAVRNYSRLTQNVLLLGATGVGKTMVAKALHLMSGRSGDFVALPGGEMTDSLFATELFGHVAGAFTDARSSRKGALERADGGTLFIDEVPLWGRAAQAALLRPLSERLFRPVGSDQDQPVRCRFIFASTRELDPLVQEGILLPDLRHRIPLFEIRIPSLRERRGDIIPLSILLCREASLHLGLGKVDGLAETSMRYLLGHPWPGNVRQLYQVIERASAHAVFAGRDIILPGDFPNAFLLECQPILDLPEDELLQVIEWGLLPDGNGARAAGLLGVHRNTIAKYRPAIEADLKAKANRAVHFLTP